MRLLAVVPFAAVTWSSLLWDAGSVIGTVRLVAFGVMVGAYIPPVVRFARDFGLLPHPVWR